MISFALLIFSWGMVFSATVITWMVGMLWYSPLIFGKRWVPFSSVCIERSKYLSMFIGLDFVIFFIQTYLCAWLVENFEAWKFSDALMVVGTVVVVCAIFPLFAITLWEGRSLELFAIHAGCILLTFLVMTSILIYVVF